MSAGQEETEAVARIGAALLNWISTTETLGHASPGETLDYVHGCDEGAPLIVKDFVAWTSGRQSKSPGCEDRLRGLVQDSGYQRALMEAAAQELVKGTWLERKPAPLTLSTTQTPQGQTRDASRGVRESAASPLRP